MKGRSQKCVKVAIQEKVRTKKWTKPWYVTLMGFDREPADTLSNNKVDNLLSQFGTIIEPTQDVFAEKEGENRPEQGNRYSSQFSCSGGAGI